MPTISTSPDRVSFEEYLRERFQVRARDILRHPEQGHLYNDPAMQFAWDSFQAGLGQGRAEKAMGDGFRVSYVGGAPS